MASVRRPFFGKRKMADILEVRLYPQLQIDECNSGFSTYYIEVLEIYLGKKLK